MKKWIFPIALLILLGACASGNYYEKFEYNTYFQRYEPHHTVDSRQDAARLIARKVANVFRKRAPLSLAVLDFTDEYGDRLISGSLFSDEISRHLLRYRNPLLIQRGNLNQLIMEQRLSSHDLLYDHAFRLQQLSRADYVLYGRIYRGLWDEQISFRCFEAGTGIVVYAATLNINYRDHAPPPSARPHRPHRPPHSSPPPSRPLGPSDNTTKPQPGEEEGLKKEPKSGGIEQVGKIKLDDKKPSDSDQYKEKKKEEEKKPETIQSAKDKGVESSNNVKSSGNEKKIEKIEVRKESEETEKSKKSLEVPSGKVLKK